MTNGNNKEEKASVDPEVKGQELGLMLGCARGVGLHVDTTADFYSAPVEVAEYCDKRVCVCLPASISPKPHSVLSQIFVYGTCGLSVLLRRRCDLLFTSGFMDDVIFAHNEPYEGTSITAAASDVIASSRALQARRRCCVVLAVPCLIDGGGWRHHTGAEHAMHHCLVLS